MSILVSGRVGRWLGVRRPVAGILVLGVGMILAGTLTPTRAALDHGAVGTGTCDLSRLRLASPAELLAFYDAGLNLVIFLPVGVAIGLAPRSRRRAALIIGAAALPFVIEVVQLNVPAMDRACEAADVINNLTGLAVGLATGALLGRLVPGLARPAERPGAPISG